MDDKDKDNDDPNLPPSARCRVELMMTQACPLASQQDDNKDYGTVSGYWLMRCIPVPWAKVLKMIFHFNHMDIFGVAFVDQIYIK